LQISEAAIAKDIQVHCEAFANQELAGYVDPRNAMCEFGCAHAGDGRGRTGVTMNGFQKRNPFVHFEFAKKKSNTYVTRWNRVDRTYAIFITDVLRGIQHGSGCFAFVEGALCGFIKVNITVIKVGSLDPCNGIEHG